MSWIFHDFTLHPCSGPDFALRGPKSLQNWPKNVRSSWEANALLQIASVFRLFKPLRSCGWQGRLGSVTGINSKSWWIIMGSSHFSFRWTLDGRWWQQSRTDPISANLCWSQLDRIWVIRALAMPSFCELDARPGTSLRCAKFTRRCRNLHWVESGGFYLVKWLAWGVPRLLKIQYLDCKTRENGVGKMRSGNGTWCRNIPLIK